MAQVQRVLDERKIKEETDHRSTARQMGCGYSVTITREKVMQGWRQWKMVRLQ